MMRSLLDRLIRVNRVHAAATRFRSPVFSTIFDPLPEGYLDYDLASDPKATVAVIGLPKSGNNWLLGLISHCLEIPVIEEADRGKAGAFLTSQPFSSRLYFRRDLRYAAYITRDLRDIVCSYYHFLKSQPGRHRIARFDDIETFYFEHFITHLSLLYAYPNHAEDYLRFDIPVVRYERLWDDPERELVRLFARWGQTVSAERIADAVQAHQFDKMKASGKNDRGHVVPASHIRKGGYGNYREELPGHVLADIETRYGSLLQRWGYQLSR